MTHRDQQPLMVFHDLEGYPSKSRLAKWPLHFTIIPYFSLEKVDKVDALRLIASVASAIGPFEVTLGEAAMYGPDNNVQVTKLEGFEKLKDLHIALVQYLGAAGCRFLDLSYACKNYSPHISHKAGATMPESGFVVCRSISVAGKSPGATPDNKLIEEKIDL